MEQINKDEIAAIEHEFRNVKNLTGNVWDAVRVFDAKDETIRQQAADIERKKEFIETRTAQWMAALEREQELQSALHKSEEARKAAERERDEARDGSWKAIAEMAERENAALRECLEWYADDVNWIGVTRCAAIVNVDGGEKARTLIAELDRKDTQPKEGEHGEG